MSPDNKRYRRTLTALLSLGTFAIVWGQTVAPVPKVESPPNEVVELSPFSVKAESEVGYVATSSLAGSRINTPLKNIAAQIDVMTPEFLGDIGAVSIADAVAFSTSTGDNNQQNTGPNAGTDDVRGEGRARGFDNVTLSADFFATNLPSDFYNIERLTVANGPQSILFGLGNAGGVLDVTTKRALFKNTRSLELRTDTQGSFRTVLDLNQKLIDQRLALRLVALRGQENRFIEGGYNDPKRLFGTATWKPFKDTTVRVSAERSRIKLSTPTNFISQDYLSPWAMGGRALFDNSRGNTAIVNATNPLYSRNATVPRVVTYDSAALFDVRSWNGASVTKGPHQQSGAADVRDRSLLIDSIYPTEADPRVGSRLNDIDGNFIRAVVEQKVTDHLFVELSANREKRHEWSGGLFNAAEGVNLLGDGNRYLPGGTATVPQTTLNPNAGRTYLEALPNGTERRDLTAELRLSVSYEFDFEKRMKTGRFGWLGRHRLVGLLSQRHDENLEQANRAMALGNPSFATGDKLNASRTVRVRYYLDPAKGNLRAGALSNSIMGPWTFTDAATGTGFETRLFDNPEGSSGVTTGGRTKVGTTMGVVQSDFWRERINLFYGYRVDSLKNYDVSAASKVRKDQIAANDRLGLFRHLSEAGFESTPQVDAVGRSKSYGAVVHPLSWLSAFYSKSANYALPPGFRGPDDKQLPGTFSDGRDYGIRVELWEGRVSARLNFYNETQNANIAALNQPVRDFAAAVEERLRGSSAPAGIGPVPVAGFDPVSRGVGAYQAIANKAAKGIDLTVVARLTSHWDLRMSGGRQQTLVSDKAEDFAQWVEGRLPVWTNAGGLGWDNITITPTDTLSIRQYYTQIIAPEIASNRARDNLPRFRQREYRANLFTNYRFTEAALKGFSVGGGARWLSKAVIGFEQQKLTNGNTDDDPTKPLYNRSLINLDFVGAYQRSFRMHGIKTGFRLQLNVRNVLDNRELEVIRSARDTTALDVARNPGREIIVTTRFTF